MSVLDICVFFASNPGKFLTYKDVMEEFGCNKDYATRDLLTCFKYGKLHRMKIGRKYHYSISNSGIRYLKWVAEGGNPEEWRQAVWELGKKMNEDIKRRANRVDEIDEILNDD